MLRRKAQKNRKHLLIVGIPRSGTSLLASLIGAHPKVSITNEDFTNNWLSNIGKPVVGNKLCVPRQLDWSRRNTISVRLLNKFGLLTLWPKSRYAVTNYLKLPNLHIIGIKRSSDQVYKSLKNRGAVTWKSLGGNISKKPLSEKIINYTITMGEEILDRLEAKENSYFLEFEQLLDNTEKEIQAVFNYLDLEYRKGIIAQGTKWNWIYPKVSEKGINKSKM